MERLTIPDVRVDEHTTRRTMIDGEAVREHAMDFYWRLKAYEDTGLTPKEFAAYWVFIQDLIGDQKASEALSHLLHLAQADKDGRLVVLPCKVDGSMLNTSDPERPEIMKRIHFAVAYVCGGIVFHQPYNIFLENVAAGYIRPLNEEAEKALEAMKDGN
nr:MAG TPA: hypothetical protein [Caudoviricetes sp.]